MQRPLSAGDTVESQCTRCKALLNHTIIAMVAGEVVRVKCNTCGSEHNHRPTKAAKSPAPKAAASTRSAAPRTSRAKVAGPSDEEIWEELIRPLDPDHAVPYRMDGKFKTNTLIAHPSFGTGVIAATNPGKIEVVFKCGKKLLRCA
ncbi:hypothetical protein [Geomesophilobacter sediminis]|uniref:Uncharacterized protein n=1 Tax=Geomesophilobacter sediminis TaxID=2798584 RepID=A0A8J7IPE8_9BACT|nr:hypothetical protein [Geomesophilobacter sediminis]MBJ6724219.1 hypothetical protein [Geomesophilobacter sediminis]